LRTTARLISILFHPIVLPTYAFLLVYLTNPLLFSAYNDTQLGQIFLRVVINTFVFPVIAMLLVWRLGFVKSLEMNDPKERLVPYITTGAFYTWSYIIFRKSGLPQMLDIIILGATITLFVIFFINIFKKVSAHTAAMGSFIIVVITACILTSSNFTFLVIPVVLLAGIIGSSRLLLNAHDTTEIFAGYIIGIASQIVALQFY